MQTPRVNKAALHLTRPPPFPLFVPLGSFPLFFHNNRKKLINF
jgi:hypothetical protein